jgi:hypothetical protein
LTTTKAAPELIPNTARNRDDKFKIVQNSRNYHRTILCVNFGAKEEDKEQEYRPKTRLLRRERPMAMGKDLSGEPRLRILKIFEFGDLYLSETAAATNVRKPKVFFNLLTPRNTGFVKDYRDGKWTDLCFDESGFFKKFSVLSVVDRISEDIIQNNKRQLKEFRLAALKMAPTAH